jgi:uncharacterized protein (DUF4415 family)
MPTLKPGTIIPTKKENAAITRAARSDQDAIPFSNKDWIRVKAKAQVGRPHASVTKERITIRLSRDVVEQFRASGDGWQTRVDKALKDWLKTHSPA